MSSYPYEFQVRDAKAIRSFVETTCGYKSSRWNRLKGEAYDAGNRLATQLIRPRPTTAAELAELATIATGISIDTGKRTRHFAAIAARPENVAARNAAYERIGLRARSLDGSE